MSEQENYNHEENSSQDGVYSYSYRDINQGDPVGGDAGGASGSAGTESAGYQSSFTDQSGAGSQQTEHYQWNPYQETKKKGFFERRRESRSKAQASGGGKKSSSFSVKLGKTAAIALVFGLVAGVVFQGSSYLMGRALGTESGGTSASLNTGSISPTSTSSAITVTDVSDVVDNVLPSVVAVTNMTTVQYQNFFGRTGTYESQSAGSGIIVSQDEDNIYIATNDHVVSGAETLTITFVDGTSAAANIEGSDSSTDLAVVSVPLDSLSSDTRSQIKVATIGDSDELSVGQSAIVIGNALGYGQSVSAGIISALNREVQLQNTDGTVITNSLIQTDAAVNPGNSGGALVDMNGKVVGIVSAKYTDTDVEGMGYAIPISSAADIIQQMITQEVVDESESAYFGIAGADVTSDFAQQYGLPTGVYITQVEDGSAADEAGLSRGDVIISFNGRDVTSMNQIQSMMQYIKAGTDVDITVARAADDYEETNLTVTMGSRN